MEGPVGRGFYPPQGTGPWGGHSQRWKAGWGRWIVSSAGQAFWRLSKERTHLATLSIESQPQSR